jgi:hypothetical protein
MPRLKLVLDCLDLVVHLHNGEHLLVAGVSATGGAQVTTGACTPLEFLNLKDLLGLRRTFGFGIINLVLTTFIIHDFFHLLF